MRARDSKIDDTLNVRVVRVACAAAFAFATSVLGYAWVRAVEAALFPQADPRAVVSVTQSGFFVRCAAALFAGGAGAFGGWLLARSPVRAARVLGIGVAIGALALAAQTAVVP